MSNTREIATEILTDIYSKFEFFENTVLLNKNFVRLNGRDKAFVRYLVLNTLRRNGQVDKVINDFVKIPIKKKNFYILNLLRLSICQILFLNIKEYSIVNTAVEISKNYNFDKFVNGLLRNICRNKNKILQNLPLDINIPSWIKNDIIKNLGKDTLNKISETIVNEPSLNIKIKVNCLKKKNWEKVLDGKFILNDILKSKNDGLIEKKPFFSEGEWWVQNISSTIPVRLISKIFQNVDKSKVSILDVGAAPGGKTFQLIEENFNVKSLEISQRRIRRLKQNLTRLKFDADVICEDLLNYKCSDLFDCVLIDAPCSASGLMQKKPEILIRDKEKNIKELVNKQKRMLEKSKEFLKIGGYVVYCVCSIHSSEGSNQIDIFLRKNKNFEIIELNNIANNFGICLKKGMLTIIPGGLGINAEADGFFISIFKRIK